LKFTLNLKKLGVGFKFGKQKNALNYLYTHNFQVQDTLLENPLLPTSNPLVKGLNENKAPQSWLEEKQSKDVKALVAPLEQALSHYDIILQRYDSLVGKLLLDMTAAARWNRLISKPRLIQKKGESINGWGWVIYRVHSSGEAILPENPVPHNYTLFNFWQITFDCALKPDFSNDYNLWNLHALDSLPDFERLIPSDIENWLKEQLYRMYKTGCLWVALPDLLDSKGRNRKPNINDALYTYNMLSFGRNYDPYQTEQHFYDRPSYSNQFIPGYFKR